jgi:hypothetical protein
MDTQSWAVALIVTACSAYAAGVLLPTAARRWLSAQLLRLPLPGTLAKGLQGFGQGPKSCACSGCDAAPSQAAHTAVQPLRFHPRRRS